MKYLDEFKEMVASKDYSERILSYVIYYGIYGALVNPSNEVYETIKDAILDKYYDGLEFDLLEAAYDLAFGLAAGELTLEEIANMDEGKFIEITSKWR